MQSGLDSFALDIRPVPLLIVAVSQCALLAAVEIAFHRGLGPETTRRIAHVAGAGSVAFMPLVLHLPEIGALAVFFTGALLVTRERHVLGSIHGVDRASAGAIVFPAGLLLAVLIGWHHPAAIAYAAFVLAIADPVAAAVGRRFGRLSWVVVGGHKSLAGSAAFAVVALAIGIAIGLAVRDVQLLFAGAAALTVTVAEAGVGYGLDNLLVPVVASVLGVAWLDF